MLKFIKGVEFDGADKLSEGYQIVDANWVCANVNADKIRKVIDKFISLESSMMFCLFIEVPLKQEHEDLIIGSSTRHVDVYYLDFLTAQQLKDILDNVGSILVNDGLSIFGVLSQSGNEIGKYRYNVMKACSQSGDLTVFRKLFRQLDMPQTNELKTAWSLFTDENPGISSSYSENGRDIYDVVAELTKVGMYKAELREQQN